MSLNSTRSRFDVKAGLILGGAARRRISRRRHEIAAVAGDASRWCFKWNLMTQRTSRYWLRLILVILVMCGVGALIVIFIAVPLRAAEVMAFPAR